MSEARRINHIQSLRAIAATLVAISHISKELIQHGVPDRYHLLPFLMTWQFGVDIFFVISGFIMYHVTAGRPTGVAPAADFMKKRLVRVVPLYWLYTALILLPILFASHTVHHASIDAPYAIASFLFIPWLRPDGMVIEPVLGLGWTLNYEMVFYISMAVLIALNVRRTVTALTLLFVGATIAGLFITTDYPQIWYWTRSCILEFAFGAGIAMLFRRGVSIPTWAGIAMVVVGIAAWQGTVALWPVSEAGFNVRGITWGVAAALIVGGLTFSTAMVRMLEWGGPKGLLQQVGDASYSLYLCHMFVVRLMTMAIGRYAHGYGAILYVLVTLAVCVGAAMLSYRFLEKPLIQLGRKDFRLRPVVPKNEGKPSDLVT
ncbi:acyltransferase family protein [Sphingomonas oryzagri]|uniref:Acyltransferase n=1 Tax=Sphingomonas oryzagri TaxID=3042314 RepID=A0ABT6MYR8_9SPHN|nr:acyltransferase [Sphingomonas oryzagri]MDH7637266.1 acyltransferase [Sphingomonas oryzagri]